MLGAYWICESEESSLYIKISLLTPEGSTSDSRSETRVYLRWHVSEKYETHRFIYFYLEIGWAYISLSVYLVWSFYGLRWASCFIQVFDPGSKLGLSSPNQIIGFAILFDLQQRRCSYALTTPTMEDLRVSLQSARHSFLQTVTGCTFPHSLHLPFVQGGESTAIKRLAFIMWTSFSQSTIPVFCFQFFLPDLFFGYVSVRCVIDHIMLYYNSRVFPTASSF